MPQINQLSALTVSSSVKATAVTVASLPDAATASTTVTAKAGSWLKYRII